MLTKQTGFATPRIYESGELHGLTGDKGERFCVFVCAWGNPLNSEWAWRATREEAEDLARRLIDHGL